MLHGIPFIRMAHTARTSQRPVLSEHRTSSVRAGVIRAATCRPHRLAVRQTWSTKVHAQRGAMVAQFSPPPPQRQRDRGTYSGTGHTQSTRVQIHATHRGFFSRCLSLGYLSRRFGLPISDVSWDCLLERASAIVDSAQLQRTRLGESLLVRRAALFLW